MHRIVRNQSLAEIARLYRVTPQRLSRGLNHLPGGRLRGIRELVVPAVAGPGVVAVVTPAVAPAAGAAREVVVRRGDTLSAIAARHRRHARTTLARLNGMDLDDPLAVGARLRLTSSP